MESQPQNPEFLNYPENFYPWTSNKMLPISISIILLSNSSYKKRALTAKVSRVSTSVNM